MYKILLHAGELYRFNDFNGELEKLYHLKHNKGGTCFAPVGNYTADYATLVQKRARRLRRKKS